MSFIKSIQTYIHMCPPPPPPPPPPDIQNTSFFRTGIQSTNWSNGLRINNSLVITIETVSRNILSAIGGFGSGGVSPSTCSIFENKENKDTKSFIQTLFETMFRKLELLRKLENKDDRWGIQSYLKRCFWSWNCWENFESKDDIWWIITLFKTMFRNRWEYFKSMDDIWCLMTLFKTMFERIN